MTYTSVFFDPDSVKERFVSMHHSVQSIEAEVKAKNPKWKFAFKARGRTAQELDAEMCRQVEQFLKYFKRRES